MAEDRAFELGVVMAGAVSAGAYSAGVVDFLFEALDEYDDARRQPGWDGPTHDVRIPVLSGASAGGMTSAITALHAFRDLDHVWPGQPIPKPQSNRLYSSWVTDISIRALLDTADLEGGRDAAGLTSLLCCDVLDRIVDAAFDMGGTVRQRNWIGGSGGQPLRVKLTLTNVRGVPYSFEVFGAGASERLGMLNHADYFDFSVGLKDQLQATDALALDAGDLGAPDWARFKSAALATGAFPVGLRPRVIERHDASWYKNAGCVGYENAAQKCFLNIPPDSAFGGESPYRFSAVDGGVIDNEPLELARRYLAGGPQKHNDQNGEAANKAVVLIAPFPSFRAPPVADETLKLIHLLPHLGSALIDQARFKLDELEQATNERIFSRFMVSPVRHSNKTPAAVALPIASGAMGGFSGFLHESFRHHDYLLGRRNMQAFLRWNFALPETNLLFKNVDINKQRWQVGNADKATGSLGPAADRALPSKLFAARVDEAPSTPGFPIIPLVDRLRTPIDIGPDDMPKPGAISLDDIRSWIKKRADIVVATLVDVDLRKETDMLPWPLAKSLRFGARQFGSQIGTEKAFAVVKQAVAQVQAAFA